MIDAKVWEVLIEKAPPEGPLKYHSRDSLLYIEIPAAEEKRASAELLLSAPAQQLNQAQPSALFFPSRK